MNASLVVLMTSLSLYLRCLAVVSEGLARLFQREKDLEAKRSKALQRWRCLASILAMAWCMSACDGTYPQDAKKTLARVQHGSLKVGISPDAPLVHGGGEPFGPEVDLINQLAEEQKVPVEWIYGAHDGLMMRLKNFELALVVGGHIEDSPWEPEVSWSREYLIESSAGLQRRRLALPPGENAWQMTIDQFLLDQQRSGRLK